MHYMLILGELPENFAARKDPARSADYWNAWGAYVAAVHQSGVFVSGNGLEGPETGTLLRVRDGVRHVQDGPFADTKEQLGGYFILDVPDLDTALEWAARSPSAAYASVEVRPVMVMK
jgi:hypothetical protein